MPEIPSEKQIKELVNLYTCTKNCFGKKDNAAGCCSLADRDFIIGPITDTKQFLKRLESSGHKYSYNQILSNSTKGKNFFPI